jgi:uncharacterized membrane protein YqjE
MFKLLDNATELGEAARRSAKLMLLMLENRLELVTLELQEEKLLLIRAFTRSLLAVLLAVLAVGMLTFAAVYFTPQEWRGTVIIALCVVLVLAAAGSALALVSAVKAMGKPLARTIEELRRDREAL